jgi:hypothetical protein
MEKVKQRSAKGRKIPDPCDIMGGAFGTYCFYRVGNAIQPLNHRACCFERGLCRVRDYLLDNARNCRAFIFVLKKLGE